MVDFTQREDSTYHDLEDSSYEMGSRKRRRTKRDDDDFSVARPCAHKDPQLKDPSVELRRRNDNFTEQEDILAGNLAIEHRDRLRTPSKNLKYEVPSSQSPTTPLSACSFISKRVPLASREINITDTSPSRIQRARKLPELEVETMYNFTKDLQERPPSPPVLGFTRAKPRIILEQKVKIDVSPKQIKLEIEDSEEERDDEPEPLDDEPEPLDDEPEPLDDAPECLDDVTILQSPIAAGVPQSASSHGVSNSDNMTHEILEDGILPRTQPQPLSLEAIQKKVKKSKKSDIIISIHPENVRKIVNRTKYYEFRTYLIPSRVKRMWIYETAPSCTINYMALIGPAKVPGQIVDLRGLGNEEFSATGSGNSYAYEIRKVYELSRPLSLDELIVEELIKEPPQKYVYVQANNLFPRLKFFDFGFRADQSAVEVSTPPDQTQEAGTELPNAISQHTLPPSPTEPNHPRLSQATTVALTEASSPLRRPRTADCQTSVGHDSPTHTDKVIVPETPSHQRLSSSTDMLSPLQDRPESQAPDVPILLPFESSELLTRSQLLPDSLINVDLPPPPPFVEDSDLE